MIDREIQTELFEAVQEYPVVAIIGPPQTGKTTLVRECLPDYELLISIKDLSLFEKFIKLLAVRAGQAINYTSLSNATGASVTSPDTLRRSL